MKNIKIITIYGENKGKKVVILAGIHGNEVCGIKAFDDIIPKLKIENGEVTFIYANLEAIKQNKRYIEKNLNRCFLEEQPEDIKESLEGRTAKEIIPYLKETDVMLDIHASFTPNSIPFIICDENWTSVAKIFDTNLVSYNWDSFEPGSTDYYMNLQKKPGFCYECGYLGDKKTSEKAKQAIKQFLIWTGCINGKPLIKDNQRIIKVTSIYKNIDSEFRKARYFPDFEILKERTLIGKEGDKNVFCSKGDILIFVTDCEKIGEECFLTAREIKKKTLKTQKEMK